MLRISRRHRCSEGVRLPSPGDWFSVAGDEGGQTMPYEFSKQGVLVSDSVRHFMDDVIFPNEETYYAQLAEVGPDGYPPMLDKLKAAALRARAVEPLPPAPAPERPRARRCRTSTTRRSRRCSARSSSPPRPSTAARPTPATWRSSTSTAPTGSRSDWLAPLLAGEIRSAFSHDRARHRVLGRDQHRSVHRARR